MSEKIRSTTIIGVVHNGAAALGGDGQVSIGNTIIVRNGTYNELIVINKSITVMGSNTKTTILSCKNRSARNIVKIDAEFCSVKGFSINGPGDSSEVNGILVNTSNNVISSNIISNTKNGIYLDEVSANITADKYRLLGNSMQKTSSSLREILSSLNVNNKKQLEEAKKELEEIKEQLNISAGLHLVNAKDFASEIKELGGRINQLNNEIKYINSLSKKIGDY